MVDASVVALVRSYVAALEKAGLPVTRAVVFGSQAAGSATPWSDIDVIVVSPVFDDPRQRDRAMIALLWRTAARVDSRIEPIGCGVQQWMEDDTSAIIELARRHGLGVELQPAA